MLPDRFVWMLGKRVAMACAVLILARSDAALAALPDLIQRIKPSIVAVGVFDKTKSPAFSMRGTGFALGSGNLIATNAHVLPESLAASGNEILVVRIPTGSGEVQQRVAKVVVLEKAYDLALMRIEGSPLPALQLGNGTAREGQEVVFIGFPIGSVLGLSPVTHRAIISSITPIAQPGASARQLNEKVIRRLKSGAFNIYQLDGTAYPGNSGGPLLDTESGKVIGIINMVYVKGTKEAVLSHPSGISYAIPVAYLADLLQEVRD